MSPSCDSTLDYDCTISANTTECNSLIEFYETMGGCAWKQGAAVGGRRLAEAEARGLSGASSWSSDGACSVDGTDAPDHCCWQGISCECSNPSIGCVVTKIKLVGNNLCGEFQDSVANLSHLRILELSYNKIRGGVNAALATMGNLDIFMVDNNELTGSAEIMCSKNGSPLSFFSADCDDFVEITECSCCFCSIQLAPSSDPSLMPSVIPSSLPSSVPSSQPSSLPSALPSALPSSIPSSVPSSMPSVIPSSLPSSVPSSQPSSLPSVLPSSLPSALQEECMDVPGWHDSDGELYDCEWYVAALYLQCFLLLNFWPCHVHPCLF